MNRARGSVCSSSVSCCRGLGMGTCSSGEDLVIKARKPYTITKQREKWTEEEHSRFLEALKLHGRAWQRIEEHIGTKTAVQIRSHAQKFFSKLEKEAVAKGIPLGEVHDIEIPPPRPKRKPNNPYPRKICVGVVSSCVEGKDCRTLGSFSSFCSKEKATDLERCDPHEKHVRIKVLERSKETSKDRKSSESLLPFEDAERPSISSSGKVPIDACPFRDFVPLDKDTYDECSPTVKEKVPDSTDIDVGSLDQLSIDTEMKLTQERTVGLKQQQKCCISVKNDVGGSNRYPKHVSVHSIDGYHNRSVKSRESDATNLTSVYNKDEVHANLNLGTIPSISTTTGLYNSTSMSCVHLPFAAYPHFTQFFGAQDACRSFLNISSTFSSLIISTLLQNPAAHSAASLAASFWPTADVEAPIDSASETFVGGIPMRSTNSAQGMAAIAAATVAAASAWWATHGMLPFCHPSFHSCFTFAPAPASIIPTTETAQATVDNGEKEVEVTHDHSPKSQQIFDPEFSEAPGAKSSPLSSLEYDESHGGERPHGVGQKSPAPYQPNPTPDSFLQALARNKKKVDHSSCGSNVLSNSEMETENALKNLEQGREEPKEVHLDHPPSIDTNNRRSRGGSNAIESWKEVSEEGRLAFRALFSREVLPQSFSPRCTEDKLTENGKDKGAAAPHGELNGNACAAADNDHAHVADRNCSAHEGNNTGKVIQTNGIGQGKWKSHRTGFKPYKRCSMEAKENKADPVEEKCNKRIRLEGEAPM